MLSGGMARLFIQSSVLLVPLWFSILFYRGTPNAITRFIHGLTSAVLIVSFSRSFAVGIIAGLLFAFIHHDIRSRWPMVLKRLFSTLAIGSAVIIATVSLPIPAPSPMKLDAAVEERVQVFDFSGNSRLNLLSSLRKTISLYPLSGSGLGATVTYRSYDPRVLERFPEGFFTTHAIEWGALDFWYKFGIVGPLILVTLFIQALVWWRARKPALSASLLALLSIHAFTPYLNHPIGFLMLMMLSTISIRGGDLTDWLFDNPKTGGLY